MTEDRFEPTPWWEFGGDEKPVPLGPEGSWHAPDEAELIVNAEREAIIREDTEPNLVTLADLAAPAESPRKSHRIAVTKSTAVVAAMVLVLGCVAMFAWGWTHGREVVANAHRPGSVSQPTSAEHQVDSLMSSSLITNNAMKGGEG